MFNSKKFTTLALTVVLAAQVCAPPVAMAADIDDVLDRSSRVMLYASIPFGERNSKRSAPKLGLRLEQPLVSQDSISLLSYSRQRYRSLAEIRLTNGYGYSLRLANRPVYESAMSFGEGSSDSKIESSIVESLDNKAARAALIFVLGAAVLCFSETLICEDDDEYDPNANDGPPTGG